ncbi:hypothetical protein [Bacillus sp. REN10]|uniref:hypothetical protein n=1 Tax=Bacillus sp. REN10 TaxID=2782541 RepID=UPI00193B26DA|nr:hypothetical protein [Bacillus sp. REN10]
MNRASTKPYSPVAQAIREAAAAGNEVAQYLIRSKDYFTQKVERQRKEDSVKLLQQKLACTKHSKKRKVIKQQLDRALEMRAAK